MESTPDRSAAAGGPKLGHVPRAVWWTTASWIALLLGYSLLVPTYRGPDEPQHVDLADHVSRELDYPAWDERRLDPGLVRATRLAGFGRDELEFTSAGAVPRDERPSVDELRDPPRSTGRNQLPQHPPLYYTVVGGVDHVVDAVLPGHLFGSYDQQAWLYRLLSVVMVAPLPLVTWAVAHGLGLPEPVGVASALVPFCIPQLAHIGSVANNDDLLMLLFWLVTPLVVRFARGRLAIEPVVLAGLVSGLALLTKGQALVMPLWVLGALALGFRRARADRWRIARVVGAYLGTTLLAGGWWWFRNLVRYGELAPSIEYARFDVTQGRDTGITRFAHASAYYTNRRFWGDFGWIDVALPSRAIVAATVVAIVALVLALRPRAFGVALATRLVMLASLVLLMAFTCYASYRLFSRSGNLPLMQGRYWFGSLAAVSVLLAMGLAALLPSRERWLPLAVAAMAIAMQVTAVRTLVGFYWGTPGASTTERLSALVAWSPIPGEAVTVGAAIGTVVFAATVGTLATMARRPEGRLVQATPIDRPTWKKRASA